MRFLLKFLLVAALFTALWAAHYFYLHRTVLIEYAGVEVEPTLSLLLLAFVLAMVAVHVALRLVLLVLFLPRHIRNWRRRRTAERKDRLTEESLRAMALGDENAAERSLSQLAGTDVAAREAYLLAAFCAEAQGMEQRRSSLLGKAAQAGGDAQSPMLRVARGCLALAEGRRPEALSEFQAALPSQPKARRLLRLVAECQEAMGDHQAALVGWLAVAKAGGPGEKDPVAEVTRLVSEIGDAESLARLWKENLADVAKDHPEVAVRAARQLAKAGNPDRAEAILKDLAKTRPDPAVFEAVAQAGSESAVDAAVPAAERHVSEHGRSAPMLRALGMLYARKQLWKKAREMLEASLSITPDPATHDALAHMLHSAESPPEEALAQHQAAMSLRSGR